jgi:PAS domain S-box-containing protein
LEKAFEEIKQRTEAARRSERELRDVVNTVPAHVWSTSPDGKVDFVNDRWLQFTGLALDEAFGWKWEAVLHPDDRTRVVADWHTAVKNGQAMESEARVRRADGEYCWWFVRNVPLRDETGKLVRWYGTAIDIEDRKRAEEKLLRSEESLLEAQRLSHTGSWRHDIASGAVIVSPEMYRIFDIKPDDDTSNMELFYSRLHPEDRKRVVDLYERAEIEKKTDYQVDYRIVLPDGTIKHLHTIGHPVLNESGQLLEYVGTTIDVTEQWQATAKLKKAFEEIKHLKDRLHDENLALREQIDQVFMFEEIVGSSPALKIALTGIVKVAPTDSTVLITGETGTGKELIARAIHKRSQRSGQAFISVNCASIPSGLIASELFGHEKGAFTGALQRRQGRFELAHSGTIFLDEIGELPAETQIALLRVLQERQFERVGGNRPIPTDARIIAATNRDLKAAIASGVFRSDLFYRLNVVPIHVPPLRDRKEDIPMLVEYFVKRYAEKARKEITKIEKNTLELCRSYPWPGNIRELQNIIERSVIFCTGDTFWIDPAWLSSQDEPNRGSTDTFPENVRNYEKQLIEAALEESNGKIAGPNGAAGKLGIPRSTLDAKIKQLKITKYTIR